MQQAITKSDSTPWKLDTDRDAAETLETFGAAEDTLAAAASAGELASFSPIVVGEDLGASPAPEVVTRKP